MEGSRAPAPREPERTGPPWRLIAIAALAVYALLIVILNREEVDISFVFFSTRISKLVLVVLCLGIGFVLGYLFDGWRRRGAAR
jgi:hypothetical protein